MHVLLTNDDGIAAAGLEALRQVFEAAGTTVTVVAPDRERSGSGHSITFYKPLRVNEVEYPDSRTKGIAVNGTPSDCVKLAVEAIMPARPDLVISGINNGPNLGTDVLYSGTVSAAVEGALLGLPSLAVSLATFDHFDYSWAAGFVNYLARVLLEKGLPPNTLLNVNIPPGAEDLAGVAITRLGVRRYENQFDKRVDPHGRTYYWLAGEAVEAEHGGNVDIDAVRRRLISITPIHFDLTNYGIMRELDGWGLDLSSVRTTR
ncbi:MAG: 5'/3'-nucleotidase SurE [bacterium]